MARVKGIAVSNLEGRIGNVVFRNRQGVNVASQRPAAVKNPQTRPQQTQRMVFNTLVQAYSTLKTICDHSFEGVTYGAKSQAFFMKQNHIALRSEEANGNASYVFKGNPAFIPNYYLVSKGSLASPAYDVVKKKDNPVGFGDNSIALQVTFPEAVTQATLTFRQLLDALNVEKGEQLTIVAVEAQEGMYIPNTAYAQPSHTVMHVMRLVFSATAADSVLAFSGTSLNPEIFASKSIERRWKITMEKNVLEILGPVVPDMTLCIAMCMIRSRKSGDKWLRSTEYFKVMTGDLYEIDSDTLSGSVPEIAVRTYDPTDPYYLNNAIV